MVQGLGFGGLRFTLWRLVVGSSKVDRMGFICSFDQGWFLQVLIAFSVGRYDRYTLHVGARRGNPSSEQLFEMLARRIT